MIEQARHLSPIAGRFVEHARLLAALDLTLDHAAAGVHRHFIHGRIVRQRKGVHCLDGVGKRVVELLHNLNARQHAAHLRLHGGALQWTLHGDTALPILAPKCPLGDVLCGGGAQDQTH